MDDSLSLTAEFEHFVQALKTGRLLCECRIQTSDPLQQSCN